MTDQSKRFSLLNERNAFFLLLAMHIAGIIGLSVPESRSLFQQLTPFNLIVSAVLVFYFQPAKNRAFMLFLGLTFLVGYFIEVIGVSTGVIFGQYAYGATLGFKALNVPLLIGVNWVLLIYTTGISSNKWSDHLWIRCLIGAAIMTGLDVLIEPVAIRFDFWSWSDINIPVQNYLAWFIVSFALHFVFQKLHFEKNNLLAIRLLYLQLLFFGILNLF